MKRRPRKAWVWLLPILLVLAGCRGDEPPPIPEPTLDVQPPDAHADVPPSTRRSSSDEPPLRTRPRRLRLDGARQAMEPDGTLRRKIQRATVLIETGVGSGSGFGFFRSEELGYLVLTNDHVVSERRDRVEVIFDSGTPEERRRIGGRLASDPASDLSVVWVDGVEEDREVLSLALEDLLFEGQPVLFAGFPFGDLLAAGRHPEVALNGGEISALIQGASGRLESVEFDGDLNPGNSGGPIFDETGEVIGVAVAGVLATNRSLMIPAGAVQRFLAGVVWDLTYNMEQSTEGQPVVAVTFRLADPMSKITRVGLSPVFGARREQAMTVTAGQDPVLRVVGEDKAKQLQLSPWFENADGRHELGPLVVTVGDQPAAETVALRADRARLEKKWAIPARAPATSEPERPLTGIHRRISPAAGSGRISLSKLPPVEGAEVERLELGEDAGPFVDVLVEPSRPGRRPRHAFLLHRRGVVRRLEIDGMRERAVLTIGSPTSSIARSKGGLLVALPEEGEVLILEPMTLRPLAAVSVPRGEKLAATPVSPLALVASKRGRDFHVIDTIERAVVMKFHASEITRDFRDHGQHQNTTGGLACEDLEITSDGSHLLCVSSKIHRVDLRGRRLFYDASGLLIHGADSLVLNPDGKSFATRVGGVRSRPHLPRLMYDRGIFIHDLENLNIPALAIEQTGSFAFSGDPDLPYVMGFQKELFAFNKFGLRKRKLVLPVGSGVHITGVYPLSGGHGYLVRLGESLLWVRRWP